MKYVLTGDQTERLRFRLLEESDFEEWKPLFESTDTARFLGLDSSKSVDELCTHWFNKQFNRYENDLGGMNVLIDLSSGHLIGQCGLLVQQVNGRERLEVGYSILPEFWNKGYAKEAAMHCRNQAFELGFTESLISMIHAENIASERVAKHNQMELEEYLPSYEGIPANIFSISKSKWLNLESRV
jgi:RimJ/RimL family protein N-acetyltransferase